MLATFSTPVLTDLGMCAYLHTSACVIATQRLGLRAPLVGCNNNKMYENNNNLKGYKYIRQ